MSLTFQTQQLHFNYFNATASNTPTGEASNINRSSESTRNECIQLPNLDTAVCCPSGMMEELLPRPDGTPAPVWTLTGEGVGGGLTAGSSTPLRGTTQPDSGVETSPCTNSGFKEAENATLGPDGEIGVNNLGMRDKFDVLKAKGLYFMHLNARSILPKMDEIRFLINKTQVGALCISETWLDPSINDSAIEMDNYSLIRKDRNRNGGGVCVFIRSDLHFSVREDLINEEAEILMIDICLRKTNPILLGVCYRPQPNSFYEHLGNVLNKYPKWMVRECILIGNFNTDVIKKTCPTYSGYSRCCNMFGLTQLIKDPPRIGK